MNPTHLAPGPLHALRNDLHGDVILPDDADYATARGVYNSMHDRWPSLLVRCAGTADVARTVRYAAEEGLLLAVRGGNHSMRGHGSCDDGVVLDLSGMRSVEVDPSGRLAGVAGGATWDDVNVATHAHGLATTGGLISTTGVGGLTLGGGFGYLTRRLGLACDNLVAAEIVTARGEVLELDDRRHPDLFWAIRGGGGNFGVVTSFSFRLAEIATVMAGPIVFPAEPRIVRRYFDLMRGAPREFGAVLGLTIAPALPFLPVERHGQPCAVVVACWAGEESAGREVLDEIAGLGDAWGAAVRRMPYPEINTLFDGLLPRGLRHYWTSCLVREADDRSVGRFVEHGRTTPTIESGIFFYPVDGAAGEVRPDATAWPHRDARFVAGFHGSWSDPAQDAPIRDWVRAAHAACAPSAQALGYVNFASDEDATGHAYYGDHLARLREVKRRYDPNNVFCLNANVDPDGAPEERASRGVS